MLSSRLCNFTIKLPEPPRGNSLIKRLLENPQGILSPLLQNLPETPLATAGLGSVEAISPFQINQARARVLGTKMVFESKEGVRMNWDQAKGQWNQLKGSVRKQWGKLTDDDLDVIAGERERLVGKIQERYGIAKEDAERQVAGWNLPATDVPRDYQRKAG